MLPERLTLFTQKIYVFPSLSLSLSLTMSNTLSAIANTLSLVLKAESLNYKATSPELCSVNVACLASWGFYKHTAPAAAVSWPPPSSSSTHPCTSLYI